MTFLNSKINHIDTQVLKLTYKYGFIEKRRIVTLEDGEPTYVLGRW